jgi:hypothetical protein
MRGTSERTQHSALREREEQQSTVMNQLRLRRLPHLAADGTPIEREGRERERNTPPIMCGGRRATQLAADGAQRERGPRDLRLVARVEREDRERTQHSVV